MIRVLVPFPSHDLVELSTLKDELGFTDSDVSNDEVLARLITRSSGSIRSAVGYDLVRQKYRETSGGAFRAQLLLSRSPLAGTVAIVDLDDPDSPEGDGEDVTDFVVESYEAGILYRQSGWTPYAMLSRGNVEPIGLAGSESPRFRLDYWAGWIPPGYEVTGATMSAAASDDSFNDSISGFPTFIQPGDLIRVSGFSNAPNNGVFRVTAATAAKLTVEASLTTEAAGATVTIDPRSLPGDLEDAALALSKSLWLSRRRDQSVKRETVGPHTIEYADISTSGGSMPASVENVIAMYRRAA